MAFPSEVYPSWYLSPSSTSSCWCRSIRPRRRLRSGLSNSRNFSSVIVGKLVPTLGCRVCVWISWERNTREVLYVSRVGNKSVIFASRLSPVCRQICKMLLAPTECLWLQARFALAVNVRHSCTRGIRGRGQEIRARDPLFALTSVFI